MALMGILLPLAPVRAQVVPDAGPRPASECRTALYLGRPDLTGPVADLARVSELIGAAPVRPHLIRRAAEAMVLPTCDGGDAFPWRDRFRPERDSADLRIDIVQPRWSNHFNSAYPNDRNNGALWAGRGLSTSVDGGVIVHWRHGPATLSAGLAPAIIFQENHDFQIVTGATPSGYSPFVNPWHPRRIDWPQRFGEDAFWVLDPGQSFIRVDAYHATVGFSTENLWWGPALRNPLLMSNTAPGFPHVFLGTSSPLELPIGTVEARAVWGHLAESDYFDRIASNDRRMIAGLVFDYGPRWLPGLFLGFARAFLANIPADGLSISEYVSRPYGNLRSNPVGGRNPLGNDQILSVFARWALPAAGFEAYAEWGREDNWDGLEDLIMEPDHSEGYTLGFQKMLPAGDRWIRFYGEWTNLETPPTYRTGRAGGIAFYVHHQIRQGYTQRGQLLGASIGPGSSAQFLGADLYDRWGRLGLFVERIRHDNDAYYNTWAFRYGYKGHDVELTGGIHHLFFDGPFRIGWGLAYSRRYNRNFLALMSPAPRIENNWTFDLGVVWQPFWPERTTARVSAPRAIH